MRGTVAKRLRSQSRQYAFENNLPESNLIGFQTGMKEYPTGKFNEDGSPRMVYIKTLSIKEDSSEKAKYKELKRNYKK